MGSDTAIEAIGFDVLLSTGSDNTKTSLILINTINWMYTNWRGMSFGLLLGALLLSILPYFKNRRSNNPYLNSFFGMLFGAPMGVCANCATPIAHSMLISGRRAETALATLLSSPTLNIIVLTMSFSLLPSYMAVIKLGMTIGFILLILPLISKRFTFDIDSNSNEPFVSLNPRTVEQQANWGQALLEALSHFISNLWLIVKTTLPLMVLAGFLGATLITLVPFETILESLPQNRLLFMLLPLLALSIFGLFLPVPIGFDIIVVAILLNAGLPVSYSMVLLFSLGIFSVYPFMMLATSSYRLASSLAVGLIIFSVLAGVLANRYENNNERKQSQYFLEQFKNSSVSEQKVEIDRLSASSTLASLLPQLEANHLLFEPILTQENIEVSQSVLPVNKSPNSSSQWFENIDALTIGLNENEPFTALKLIERYALSRGIASADIHNDGWVDVAIASASGIGLYANIAGQRFIQQRVNIPAIQSLHISTVALIDLNNDGWNDLVFSAFNSGVYIIRNVEGEFLEENLQKLALNQDVFVSTSLSFSDFDRNGELDIFIGNSAPINAYSKTSFAYTQNLLAMQVNGTFTTKPIANPPSETLTALSTDINNDQWPDLFIGNDHGGSDIIMLNNGKGELIHQTKENSPIAISGQTTMSIVAADIDNDLSAEIYLAQRSEQSEAEAVSADELCNELRNPLDKQTCFTSMQTASARFKASAQRNIKECSQNARYPQQVQNCIALVVLSEASPPRSQGIKHCEPLEKKWPLMHQACERANTPIAELSPSFSNSQLTEVNGQNMLFKQNFDGDFRDIAHLKGLEYGSWSWNAMFEDLDNDGWQDLFIVTGMPVISRRHPSLLFQNKAGAEFKNITENSGLASMRDVLSYTYIDYDNDGDQDIVSLPSTGLPLVYQNTNTRNNSIRFKLIDHVTNRSAVGAQVRIFYGDQQQMREITASGGYLSYNAPIAHFGIQQFTQIDRLEVIWPDGIKTTLKHTFQASSIYTVERSKSLN